VKFCVYAFSSFLIGASMLAAQTPTKVGIINIQNAILGTREGQKALQELEARSAPKKQELEKRQQDILSRQDQLNKMGNVGNEAQKQKLMADIDQMKKAFSRDVEDAQADLDQENGRVMNNLGNRMLALLDKYAKDNGYAVILDVSNPQTSAVLFASSAIDVTPEMTKLFDATPAGSVPQPATSVPRQTAPTGTGAARPTGTPGGAVARPATPAVTSPAAPKK
jgi:outer membrane protein